jgi:hypothetical protein
MLVGCSRDANASSANPFASSASSRSPASTALGRWCLPPLHHSLIIILTAPPGSRKLKHTSPSFGGNRLTQSFTLRVFRCVDSVGSAKQQAPQASDISQRHNLAPESEIGNDHASVFSLSSLKNNMPSVSLPSLSLPSVSISSFFSTGSTVLHPFPFRISSAFFTDAAPPPPPAKGKSKRKKRRPKVSVLSCFFPF